MKLISKFKDYYDYLINQYGVDNKIVYNRIPDQLNLFEFSSKDFFLLKIWLCGYVYYGIYDKGKTYYGNDLLNYGKKINKESFIYRYGQFSNIDVDKKSVISIPIKKRHRTIDSWTHQYISTEPYKDPNEINKFLNTPVCLFKGFDVFPDILVDRKKEQQIYANGKGIIKNPNLTEINFAKVLPPQEIYLKLTDFLTQKDEIEDKRTNSEKILTNGFDLKSSFRNIK